MLLCGVKHFTYHEELDCIGDVHKPNRRLVPAWETPMNKFWSTRDFSIFFDKGKIVSKLKRNLEVDGQWICVSPGYFMYMYNLIFGISVSLGCTLGTFHFKPNFEKDETNKNIEIDSKQFSEQKLRRKYLHWGLKYFTKNCVLLERKHLKNFISFSSWKFSLPWSGEGEIFVKYLHLVQNTKFDLFVFTVPAV